MKFVIKDGSVIDTKEMTSSKLLWSWWQFFFLALVFKIFLNTIIVTGATQNLSVSLCYCFLWHLQYWWKRRHVVLFIGIELTLNCNSRNSFQCSSQGINNQVLVVITIWILISYFLKYNGFFPCSSCILSILCNVLKKYCMKENNYSRAFLTCCVGILFFFFINFQLTDRTHDHDTLHILQGVKWIF